MRTCLSIVSLAGLLSAQASLTVQTTEPAAYGKLGVFDPVRVTFAQAVDPATVTTQSFGVFGSWTGVVSGTVQLDATHTVVTFQPNLPLLLGDCLRVDLRDTITAANGDALLGGYHFELSVASNPGSGSFQHTGTINFRMPGEGVIGTYGIHAGDVDRDGVPDVTAINEIAHDIRVFKSDGCGAVGPMTLISDGYNWPSPHDSADFNGDGWMDLVTGDYIAGNVSIFMNDGAGNYLPPVALAANAFVRSIQAADLNGDGAYDLAAGNGQDTLVWLNDGTGNFLPSTAYGQPGAEINVVDVNGLPLGKQRDEIMKKRRHGMGYLGLGSTLTMIKIKYGDPESIKFTEEVTRILAEEGWKVGIELAKEKGSAPIMEELFEITEQMLQMRPEMKADGIKVGDKVAGKVLMGKYSKYMQQFPEELRNEIAENGVRFSHHSSIAPTGTISLSLANNASNGIEPSFAHHYSRNVIREGKKTKEKVDVFSFELLAYRSLINDKAMPFSDKEEANNPDRQFFVNKKT